MSKSYTVSLPVKPYILKYVQTVEGSTAIEFKGTSMLCIILRAFLLNQKQYTGYTREKLKAAVSVRTAELKFVVPVNRMNQVGTEIDPNGVVVMNRLLEEFFDRAFLKFMKDRTKKEGRYRGYKEAYYAFADLYNIEIEEDITFDGLKKMDQRLRDKQKDDNNKNGPNFFSNLVPSF